MQIEVVYAEPPGVCAPGGEPAPTTTVAAPRVWSVVLDMAPGATAGDAVAASGLLEHLPGLGIAALDLGVFNHACTPDRPLQAGDRVEIYRPLLIDPKAARHLRVAARRKAEAQARQGLRPAASAPAAVAKPRTDR